MDFNDDVNWRIDFWDRNSFLSEDEDEDLDTTLEQKRTEMRISKTFSHFFQTNQKIELHRENHIKFIMDGIRELDSHWDVLDASRPWLCYWMVHSLNFLGGLDNQPQLIQDIVDFLGRCQNESGGFGGGPGQFSHLAPTYAAVNALMICGTEEAYNIINRPKLYQFLLEMKDKQNGGFLMHHGGENDVRGCYCALNAASLCNVLTPELYSGVPEFVSRCQTYEGGMGGFPGNEAHGGYTFCALAAVMLTGQENLKFIDIENLTRWVVQRQMNFEGGFQGRTNKLVDSCYSFWQGGIFLILDSILSKWDVDSYWVNTNEVIEKIQEKKDSEKKGKVHVYDDFRSQLLFNQKSLQEYIFVCCQDERGGFRDKPGKSKDFYHTCYSLSGLSASQHNPDGSVTTLGGVSNLVNPIHPLHNICPIKASKAKSYFKKLNNTAQ